MTATFENRPRQPGKLRVGVYWASSCGGCDVSVLEIAEHLLELIEVADIVFWPCVTDFKYATVAGYPDGFIDVCLSSGAIRSSEQEEIARLATQLSALRQQLDEAIVQHDGERLEMMNGMDQKDQQLARLSKTLAEQREAYTALEREKQAAHGQLSEHRDRLRNLDTLLQEVQEQLRRGSHLAKG